MKENINLENINLKSQSGYTNLDKANFTRMNITRTKLRETFHNEKVPIHENISILKVCMPMITELQNIWSKN